MKRNTIVTTTLIAILVGGLGFFGGMQYQKMQRGSMVNDQFSNSRMQGQGGTMGQGRMMQRNDQAPVIGEIVEKDDTSITVKMADGSSKIVILSGTTAINKQATGSNADLKTGENVMIIGATNADGSVTAENIQLNPQGSGMQKITPSGSPKQ